MDVFIFGVARSGTTMLYSLCQRIFGQLYGEGFRSSYEPFIWDRDQFNAPYEDTRQLFGKTGALSVEGIYNHVKTPLFVPAASAEQYLSNEFYRYFSASAGHPPHVAKLIRGNGRMAIFRALNPGAGLVLVVRNPVDVVNSVKHKFSLYGEDFYPSDLPRFRKQLGSRLVMNAEAGWAQQQAEYCYQMNRAALEFAHGDPKTFVIEYDHFTRNKLEKAGELCGFLGLGLTEDAARSLGSPTGPVTTKPQLSQSEFESILAYDDLHTGLCGRYGVSRGRSREELITKYDGNCTARDYDIRYQDFTTNRLRRIIMQKSVRIRELEQQLAKLTRDPGER